MLNISWVLDRFETRNAPDQGNVKHVWLRGKDILTFPVKCMLNMLVILGEPEAMPLP